MQAAQAANTTASRTVWTMFISMKVDAGYLPSHCHHYKHLIYTDANWTKMLMLMWTWRILDGHSQPTNYRPVSYLSANGMPCK
jgi:hypothetical protein